MKGSFFAVFFLALMITSGCRFFGTNNVLFLHPRASESSAIALSSDDRVAATVNENGDSVSFFDVTTSPPTLIKELKVGDEPVAVVIAADNNTAFVANQADATVTKIVNISKDPAITDTIDVGSEPVGLALSPLGTFLFVAEFAQNRVSKIKTSDMKEIDSVETPFPFGIAVTNDVDIDEDDETVVVTRVFGEPTGVLEGSDKGDESRRGKVFLFSVADLSSFGAVNFEPRDSGVAVQPGGTNATNNAGGETVFTSPNQLYAVTIQGDTFFVPTVSASPTRDVQARGGNIHPIVLAGSVKNELEVGLSVNLEKLIKDLIPDIPCQNLDNVDGFAGIVGAATADEQTECPEGTRNFLGDTTSIAVSPTESNSEQTVVYSLARGGDAVQRIVYDLVNNEVSIDDFNSDSKPDQIDLFPGCRTPMGIAVAYAKPAAYVNCRGTRQLVSLNLTDQSIVNSVASSTAPVAGSKQADIEKGQLLYFTSRARWSSEARSDCAACHFNGVLSDNIVWTFGAGPRRTIPMHWSYHFDDNNDGVKEEQKILNWTGIFDEVRDFENNIINVSSGVGVYTTKINGVCDKNVRKQGLSKQANADANLSNNGLNGSAIEFEEDNLDTFCAPEDFRELDLFVRTMRSPRGPKTFGDNDLEDSIARGRDLFAEANCQSCHGGDGWTASRLYYDVTKENTDKMKLDDSSPIFDATDFPQIEDSLIEAFDTFLALGDFDVAGSNFRFIQNEQIDGAVNGDAVTKDAVKVLQEACVLRDVNTFGDPDDADDNDPAQDGLRTKAIEIRGAAAASGGIAEGRFSGYNIPPLLGVASNAPYFHHGQAVTLDALLTESRWATHLKAGNKDFILTSADVGKVQDLKNFLLSIDENTTPFIGTGVPVDVCP